MKLPLLIMGTLNMILCAALSFAQTPEGFPGNIQILPGYQHQRLRGIDSVVGRISRKDGLTIQYDVGSAAGNYAEKAKEDCKWFKEQTLSGNPVQIALKKNNELVVTFPDSSANFVSSIRNEEDITDVLLMVLTYKPAKKQK